MANEINVTNTYCGCGGSKVILANGQCEENPVFKTVDELPGLGDATRNHAYVLPDNTVWVVNSEGTDFSQLNGVSGAGGAYDDTELRGLIQQALDRNTMEDNRLTNIENKNATQDQRIAALENRPSGGETYDDTAIKERLEALEDCVIEEGGRQIVDIADQVKTYDEPLVVEDRTFDKYIDITFEGTNAIPGTEGIYFYDKGSTIFSLIVDKGDGSEPTNYLDSFSTDVDFRGAQIPFDPSKTTRVSFNSLETDFDISIAYETAGGCLSERVEAIEAVLRNLGYM